MTPASWHTNMMASMKRKTDAELRFIRKDAVEASLCAYGLGNPVQAGRYADEAHYANMELFKRLQRAQHEESVKQAQAEQARAEREGETYSADVAAFWASPERARYV